MQPQKSAVGLNWGAWVPTMTSIEETWEYIRSRFCDFLETFVHERTQKQFYMDQLQAMQQEDMTTMYVDLEHLATFDTDLADLIQVSLCRLSPPAIDMGSVILQPLL